MEIFQTIWTALTTPNENLLKILTFPIYFIDAIVSMFLFTTILNMTATRKRKIIYIISYSLSGFILKTFIPDPYASFLTFTINILLIKFILNSSWFKAIFAQFIVVAISSVLELFLLRFYLKIFKVSYDLVMTAPFYRITFILIIYACVYIIYRIIKYFKFHVNLSNMSRKDKILFFVTTILGIISIGAQFALLSFYSDNMSVAITFISMLSLLAYFILSIYSLFSTNKLYTTSQSLEEAQLHLKTLTLLHDSMRGFKHDFHNIVQGLGGYIDSGDMDGLRKYYKQLLEDCNRTNNLTALSPTVINNPPIYNVLATKYHRADEIGIQINLTILMDLNQIEQYMKIYEFTRILGILMDNAIEAAIECKKKIINVTFRKEHSRHRLVMVIENTYLNKDIDTEKIFEKSYSTKSKKTNSGLGLWEVRQILKRNNNLNLFTTKNDEYFVQQFEIYY